jgi:hypothetical protein
MRLLFPGGLFAAPFSSAACPPARHAAVHVSPRGRPHPFHTVSPPRARVTASHIGLTALFSSWGWRETGRDNPRPHASELAVKGRPRPAIQAAGNVAEPHVEPIGRHRFGTANPTLFSALVSIAFHRARKAMFHDIPFGG